MHFISVYKTDNLFNLFAKYHNHFFISILCTQTNYLNIIAM